MKKFFEQFNFVKALGAGVALFCTGYTLCNANDLGLFYTSYFAGAATVAALYLICDEEEDP